MKSDKKLRETVPKRRPPARNPEQREQQMIGYAVDLAEEQLRNGTASSQVIVHYLKLATMREKMELEMMRNRMELDKARIRQIENDKERNELYAKAINAMMECKVKKD